MTDQAQPLTLAAARGFTKSEMAALGRIRDRIRFDLAAMPDSPNTGAWRDRQTVALAVICERIAHGR